MMIALGGCGMGGHLLLTQAFRHAPPATLAPFSYGQIIFAGLLGLLVFGHVPDAWRCSASSSSAPAAWWSPGAVAAERNGSARRLHNRLSG